MAEAPPRPGSSEAWVMRWLASTGDHYEETPDGAQWAFADGHAIGAVLGDRDAMVAAVIDCGLVDGDDERSAMVLVDTMLAAWHAQHDTDGGAS